MASFVAGSSPGTLIAAITGFATGETITSVAPNDGRLALDSTRRMLLVGLSSSAAAGSIGAVLTTSAGRTLNMALAVTANPSGFVGPLRVGYVGDSITEYGVTNYAGSPANVTSVGGGFGTNGRQFWTQRLTAGRVITNPDWTTAILATAEPQVITWGIPALLANGSIDAIVAMVGTNTVIGGTTSDQQIAWSLTMQNQAIGGGKIMIWESILPRVSGSPSVEDPAQKTKREAVNAWRKAQANGVNVFYIDLMPAITNPDGSLMNTAAIYLADGQNVHPNGWLAYQLGKLEAAWFNANVLLPVAHPYGYAGGTYAKGTNDYGNRVVNPTFAGSTGTRSNTVGGATPIPTSWTANRDSTAIDAQFALQTDNSLQLTLSGTSDTSARSITLTNSPDSSNLSPTARYMAEVDVSWTGVSGLTTIFGNLTTNAGQAVSYDGIAQYTNDVVFNNDSGTATIRVPWNTGRDSSQQTLQLGVQASPSATISGTVKFSAPRVFQVPPVSVAQYQSATAAKLWRVSFDADQTAGAQIGLARMMMQANTSAADILLPWGQNVSGAGASGGPSNQMYDLPSSAGSFGQLRNYTSSTGWTSSSGDLADGAHYGFSFRIPMTFDAISFISDANYATKGPKTGIVEYSPDEGFTWNVYSEFTCAAWTAAGQVQTFTTSEPALTAKTTALVARMTTAPTADRTKRINRVLRKLKQNYADTTLDGLHVLAAADAQAASLNWLASTFNVSPVNVPVFTADRGYTKGTGKLDTGFNPSTAGGKWSLNSAFLGAVMTGSGGAGSWAGGNTSALSAWFTNANTGYVGLNAGFTLANTNEGNPGVGTVVAYRASASSTQMFRVSFGGYNQLLSNTTASSAVDTADLTYFADATGQAGNPATISAGFFGAALSGDQFAQLNGALNAYLLSVGAPVVK